MADPHQALNSVPPHPGNAIGRAVNQRVHAEATLEGLLVDQAPVLQSLICRYLAQHTGVSAQTAQQLYQSAARRISDSTLAAWQFGIAINIARELLRTSGATHPPSMCNCSEYRIHADNPAHNLSTLWPDIAALGPDLPGILLLAGRGEWREEQAALMLLLPLEQVRSRITSALQALPRPCSQASSHPAHDVISGAPMAQEYATVSQRP